jgi:hypothetical protein
MASKDVSIKLCFKALEEPTKLVRTLLDRGNSPDEAKRILKRILESRQGKVLIAAKTHKPEKYESLKRKHYVQRVVRKLCAKR